MNRLTKAQIKEYARLGLPIETILPESELTGCETVAFMVFPPGLEDYLPTHREAIVTMRAELKMKIGHLPPNGKDNFIQGMMIASDYVTRINDLCGKEAYLEAGRNTPYTREFKTSAEHNVKMNNKLQEYQRRPCGNCGQMGPWRNCGRCHQIYYCGKECQTSHWSTHKPDCVTKE